MPDITRYRPVFRALLPLWFIAVLWGSLTSEAKLESMEELLPFLAWSDKLLHFGALRRPGRELANAAGVVSV